MTSFVKNLPAVLNGIDLEMRRINDAFVNRYRDVIWLTFCRILDNTPQYSGLAVANWRIGVGAPDTTFDRYLGDPSLQNLSKKKWSHPKVAERAYHKGSQEWIEQAKRREAHKIPLVKRHTKVFITNNVQGDRDGGATGEYGNFYLEALQDPAYWRVKLRGYNRPYETAHESFMLTMGVYKMSRSTKQIRGGDGWKRYIGDT